MHVFSSICSELPSKLERRNLACHDLKVIAVVPSVDEESADEESADEESAESAKSAKSAERAAVVDARTEAFQAFLPR